MIIFITGATSGIGMATAAKFAAVGHKLILCGRREEILDQLQSKLDCETTSLVFDLTERAGVASAIESLSEEWSKIDILINCAGNAHGLSPLDQGSIDDWDAMIDGNVQGLLYVSKPIIKGMVQRRSGHIVNISSSAGKEVYPNGAVYCASKSAVDAISKGMRLDLAKYGIRVSNISPGAVETEFSMVRFKGDKDKAAAVYSGYTPLKAEDVADSICYVVNAPAHVNISEITLFPTAQASATTIYRD